MIAQALGAGWFWSYAPALVGDDFRPLSGPDPGGPAYGNLLVSRLPLAAVEHLRFPPAGGGEQRTAILASIQVGSRPVTVAATHLSNRQGHVDPGRPGANTVHFTFFTKSGSEQAIDGANASMTTPLGKKQSIDLQLLTAGHFAANLNLPTGPVRFTINATPAQGPPITASFSQQIK